MCVTTPNWNFFLLFVESESHRAQVGHDGAKDDFGLGDSLVSKCQGLECVPPCQAGIRYVILNLGFMSLFGLDSVNCAVSISLEPLTYIP